MLTTEDVEYDEALIGQNLWWSDLRVEVTELAKEPTEPAVYLADVGTNLPLGSVYLSDLSETSTVMTRPKDLVFSESLVGRVVYWGDSQVRISEIKTYPSKGKVYVLAGINPRYHALVNVEDLTRHRREKGQRRVTPAVDPSIPKPVDLRHLETWALRLAGEMKDLAAAIADFAPRATSSSVVESALSSSSESGTDSE
jgi:hypothetical protein